MGDVGVLEAHVGFERVAARLAADLEGDWVRIRMACDALKLVVLRVPHGGLLAADLTTGLDATRRVACCAGRKPHLDETSYWPCCFPNPQAQFRGEGYMALECVSAGRRLGQC